MNSDCLTFAAITCRKLLQSLQMPQTITARTVQMFGEMVYQHTISTVCATLEDKMRRELTALAVAQRNANKEKIALCEGRHETMRLLHFDFSRLKDEKQVTKLK